MCQPVRSWAGGDTLALSCDQSGEYVHQPKANQATREAVAVVFQAFHRYMGVAIGEHLGYIFTSAWTILLCMAILVTHEESANSHLAFSEDAVLNGTFWTNRLSDCCKNDFFMVCCRRLVCVVAMHSDFTESSNF